jgi:hypothetical protein
MKRKPNQRPESNAGNRPWILYESGVAKGKLDTTVLGVAVGIPLDQTQAGPFEPFTFVVFVGRARRLIPVAHLCR